jgi:ATP-dependent 26S proteasome regulatory subunit
MVSKTSKKTDTKKLMALFTAAVLATTVFAGCGDSSAETDTDVEATSSDEACSDETFATLQDTYATLTELYNAVYEAYMSDAVEQDDTIETTLSGCEDVMTQMGEISQDTITESDAVALIDQMNAIADVLNVVIDAL